MTHYVLIDSYSGFVWGEADADDPVEACRVFDATTSCEPRDYAPVYRLDNSTASGYFVHKAPDGWVPVTDGQDPVEIDRVSALPLVAHVAFRPAGAP